MNSISRKLVLLFALIIWQSSLGTNYALKDFSNVTTKNLGQNGYYKLPDGLMIQWDIAVHQVGIKQYIYQHLFMILSILS